MHTVRLLRQQITTRGWRGHLLAALAGGLVVASLAPLDVWPLGVLAVALLARLLQPLNAGAAALRGWCFGSGLFGFGTSWVYVSIHDYGYAPPWLAGGLTALFCIALGLFGALQAWIYVRWLRDKPGGALFGFAGLWVLFEWLRSWIFTGFPWLYLGYAHLDSPLAGWAPLGGVLTVSLATALSGTALLALLQTRLQRARNAVLHSALLTLIWLGGWALTSMTWTTPKGEPQKVAMVQANIPQSVKWSRDQFWPTLNLYRELSEPLWAEYDLVIWPEAAIPAFYQQAESYLQEMAGRAAAHQHSFITGVPWYETTADGRRLAYNSAVALGADSSGVYHKQQLVPFGEYVPLEKWLRGLIQFFDLPMSNFQRGPRGQTPLRAGDLRLSVFICYEVVYPDLVAITATDADVLLTISNDAWFGASIGPLQHLQMAQMRALENGRYLLRATGNGISAIVDARGRLLTRGGQFSREIVRGEVQAMQGLTPYSRSGSWPVVLLAALACLLPFVRQRAR